MCNRKKHVIEHELEFNNTINDYLRIFAEKKLPVSKLTKNL